MDSLDLYYRLLLCLWGWDAELHLALELLLLQLGVGFYQLLLCDSIQLANAFNALLALYGVDACNSDLLLLVLCLWCCGFRDAFALLTLGGDDNHFSCAEVVDGESGVCRTYLVGCDIVHLAQTVECLALLDGVCLSALLLLCTVAWDNKLLSNRKLFGTAGVEFDDFVDSGVV